MIVNYRRNPFRQRLPRGALAHRREPSCPSLSRRQPLRGDLRRCAGGLAVIASTSLVGVGERITSRHQAVASIGDSIGGLMKMAREVMQENAAAFSPDLPPAAYLVMGAVCALAPATPAAVIARTQMDKSIVSRQLHALKDAGHLVSEPDPRDGRASRYSPTPESASHFAEIVDANRARFGRNFESWSDEDLIVFAQLMDRALESQGQHEPSSRSGA